MWADGPDPSRVAELVRAFRELEALPAGPRRRRPLTLEATPEQVVASLPARDEAGTVWLDGGEQAGHLVSWDPPIRVRCEDGRVRIHSRRGVVTKRSGALAALSALQRALPVDGGRLFGFVGYEVAHEIESLPPLPPREPGLPDAWFGVHDFWLLYRSGAWELVEVGASGFDPTGLPDSGSGAGTEDSSVTGPPPGASLTASLVSLEPDDEDYRAAVIRTVDRIHAGEIFQTNLCRRFEARIRRGGAWDLYRAMRTNGDASRGAWIVADDAKVLSRSPESFLRVRERRIESRPIKGTRPRGRDAARDRALGQELAASEKDRAELAMIVDLVRNDLGRICFAGTVEVPEHAALLRLPRVWHTVSRVSGRLRGDVDAGAILRATFPPGSITGAPKIQAMIVAAGEEPRRRGVAMGAIGWIDPGGDLDLSVAIRTAVSIDDRVLYHAGCGIVADSEDRSELEESLVKAGLFLEVLDR